MPPCQRQVLPIGGLGERTDLLPVKHVQQGGRTGPGKSECAILERVENESNDSDLGVGHDPNSARPRDEYRPLSAMCGVRLALDVRRAPRAWRYSRSMERARCGVRPRTMRLRRLTCSSVCLAFLLAGCGTVIPPGSVSSTRTAAPLFQPSLSGPTTSVMCRAVAIGLASFAKGLPTPEEAISAFVSSSTAEFPLPKHGWTSLDAVKYTSGVAQLEMFRIPNAGYAVVGARSC